MKKAVIFDFNGTLFADSDKHREGWKRFLAKYGLDVDDEELRTHYLGRTNPYILKRVFGEDLAPELIAERTLEKEATYRQCCMEDPASFHLIAGAVAFLDYLKENGVDFTIATGSEYSNVDFYFDKFELGRWFDRSRVVLDDGSFPGKPAPDGYLRAAKVLGRDPADCIVFEDSISGVRAAHAAGIGQTVAITTEVSAERLLSYPGVVIAEPDFSDMIRIFEEVLSK
ncbi:MAG: HAD family phosphatase [Ruminococcaceae bacterium]|nr:HAD family phosphatase [Oscillospiraceae bacterium]